MHLKEGRLNKRRTEDDYYEVSFEGKTLCSTAKMGFTRVTREVGNQRVLNIGLYITETLIIRNKNDEIRL